LSFIGAAGAVETAFAALALRDGLLPPTLNLDEVDPMLLLHNPDPERLLLRHVPHKSIRYDDYCSDYAKHSLRFVLKNSFGFGGTNASLVLGKYDGN
jgi:3-oxoacyl-[acyl-carrier-protein] synthase II